MFWDEQTAFVDCIQFCCIKCCKLADSWEYLWICRKTEDMKVYHLESLCVQMCVYVLHESDDAQGNEIPI